MTGANDSVADLSDEVEDDDAQFAPALNEGDSIGERYRVVRLLGQGGIGKVYEAVNTWTDRHVAVKVLRGSNTSGDDILRRFKLEAQIASQLQHPNIVDVLDMGPDPKTGAVFIVQELLKGMDLRRHLENTKKLGFREAFDLMIPVMGALAAAHSKGVLHRDVKPENIFLVKDDEGVVTPKLIDFGLAKVLGEEAAKRGKTRSGFAVGTPAYMSPEQFQGPGDIDARSDIWAVGAVLFEVLSGQVPFDGPNIVAILWRISTVPPERLEFLDPSIPRDVADFVHSALQNDRMRRPATMRALLDNALALPSLADADGRALAQRHRRSIVAPSAEVSRPSGASAPSATAATMEQPTPSLPLAAPTSAVASTSSTPRPTPLGWSGEHPPPPVPALAVSQPPRQRAAVAVAVAITLLVVVVGLSLLSRSLSQSARPATASRSAPPVATAPVEVAAPREPAAEVGAPTTASNRGLADVDARSDRQPARTAERRLPRRPADRPGVGSAPRAPAAAHPATAHGLDPDRLLTP